MTYHKRTRPSPNVAQAAPPSRSGECGGLVVLDGNGLEVLLN